MGGQTALNLTKALAEEGVLDKHGVELIGAKLDAINKAEDRQLFKEAMEKIGLKTPPSGTANSWDEAVKIADDIGSFPSSSALPLPSVVPVAVSRTTWRSTRPS